MRKLISLFSLAVLLYCGGTAKAANTHLTCSGSTNQPNSDLLAFNFDTAVAVSSGGGGGGAGKPIYSLTVQIPLAPSYQTLYDTASQGRHLSSCVLTKPLTSPAAITITLSNVLISDIQLVSGGFFTNNTSSPLVQMTLSFESVTVQTTN